MSETILPDLPDDSLLRVYAAEPAMAPDAAAHACASIDKLLQQFIAEGAMPAAGVAVREGGRFLLIAWQEGPDDPLSGCRKDKLAKVLTKLERDHDLQLLDTPPLVVETVEGIRCLDRKGLRPLAAAGHVTSATPMWDLRCSTLGAWRQSARKAIEDSWMNPILARMWQSTAAFPSAR